MESLKNTQSVPRQRQTARIQGGASNFHFEGSGSNFPFVSGFVDLDLYNDLKQQMDESKRYMEERERHLQESERELEKLRGEMKEHQDEMKSLQAEMNNQRNEIRVREDVLRKRERESFEKESMFAERERKLLQRENPTCSKCHTAICFAELKLSCTDNHFLCKSCVCDEINKCSLQNFSYDPLVCQTVGCVRQHGSVNLLSIIGEEMFVKFVSGRELYKAKETNNMLCTICNVSNREIYLRPCGHFVTCAKCFDTFSKVKNACPFCRTRIKQALKVFT